jgi:hypothetical protein
MGWVAADDAGPRGRARNENFRDDLARLVIDCHMSLRFRRRLRLGPGVSLKPVRHRQAHRGREGAIPLTGGTVGRHSKAVLGCCDLSVLHVGGEWQWLVRQAGRDVAPKVLRRVFIEAKQDAETVALALG